jgi:nonsense-mediated mRNA decay protein 3
LSFNKFLIKILVKKVYGNEKERQRKRKWKLNRLKVAQEGSIATSDDRDYQDFLKDIEEDSEIREHINIYKDKNKLKAQQLNAAQQADANEGPEISLEEMLDELDINDNMDIS